MGRRGWAKWAATFWGSQGRFHPELQPHPGSHLHRVAGQEITGGATTFMMLPQQFDSSTPLTVKVGYRDGGTSGEITGTINTAHKWEAGKTVTYEINSTSINWTYTFEITQTPSAVPHTSGSSTFKIASTRQKGTSGAGEPVRF